MRRELSSHVAGAHLWTGFGTHLRGGGASLVPALAMFVLSQPLGSSLAILVLLGFTVLPIAVGITMTLWALLSTWLLSCMRFDDRLTLHLTVYGAVGGVIMLGVSSVVVWVGYLVTAGLSAFWESPYLLRVLGIGVVLGVAGSVVGRLSIHRDIRWHEWVWRTPLRDVFQFVEGKHDREEFAPVLRALAPAAIPTELKPM